MESPAAPTHWHVTKEFSVKNRGQVLREHVPGHVDRWLENGGRYQWKVKFSTGKVELMDVEQLAAAVAYSHALALKYYFTVTSTKAIEMENCKRLQLFNVDRAKSRHSFLFSTNLLVDIVRLINLLPVELD
ncbi:hypothetical protein PInf_009318 [Phytophthora infestans]|nr:hypothetical protein PInf_009318 [Phytophthora infestans]